jgi:hypothetical protein
MKKTFLKTWLLTGMFMLFVLIQTGFAADETREWTASSFMAPDVTNPTYTTPVTKYGLTIYASSATNQSIIVSNWGGTYDGINYPKRFLVNGGGVWTNNTTPGSRIFAFDVSGPTRITLSVQSQKSGQTREITIAAGDKTNIVEKFTGVNTTGANYSGIYNSQTPTTIYIFSDWGMNLHRIKAEPLLPVLNVNTTPMAFYYQWKYGPSISKVTSLSGQYLTGDVTITPPTHFEISLNNTEFKNTAITLSPVNGTIESTLIYVRLKSGLEEGAYAGNIQVSTSGPATQTIPCAGTVGSAPELPKLTVNEFFAKPGVSPSAPNGQGGFINTDANNDGIVDALDDQFIEIYNNSATKVNIGTYKIKVNGVTKHVFPAGSYIPSYSVVVVFGGGSPTGFPEGVATVASTGALHLPTTGGTISLTTDNGSIINEQAIVYGSEAENSTSITRNPEGTGNFVLHNSVSPAYLIYSPGASSSGAPFGAIPVVPIHWKWIVALFGLIAIVVVVRKTKLL